MKKMLFALSCLSFGYSVQAQQALPANPPTQKEQSTDGPKFKFIDGMTYDFGEIPEGPVAEHEFRFKNVGNRPLIINEAHGSCGCTKPDWPKDPVKPRKKSDIMVRYNTEGRVGPFTKEVFITSNAITDNGNGTTTLLHIKGTVKSRVADDKKSKN